MSGLRFLLVAFVLNIKKIIDMKVVWFGLVGLFLAVAFGGTFAQGDSPVVVVHAGVLHDSADPFESSIVQFLDKSVADIAFVEFVLYDDLEELLRDVALGRLECGYVLGDNIENALVGDFEGIVTVITSPRTIAAPILNDIVAAAILRASVEDITRDGLINIFGESEELDHFVEWQFFAYNQMDIFMVPQFAGEQWYGYEDTQRASAQIASRVLHGLIGLTLLVLSMFCAGIFIEERASGLGVSLRAHGRLGIYNLSLWTSAFAIMFVVGLGGLLAMVIFASSVVGSVLSGLAPLAFYAAVCALLLTLLSQVLKSAGLIQSFGLFLLILNIFFGGVLLNLVEVSETLEQVQWFFPLFWYIEMAM